MKLKEILINLGYFIHSILMLGLGVVKIVAFLKGLEVWFGFGYILSFIMLVVALFTPIIGAIALSIIGFYGAWKGWHLEWWQAALLIFPETILLVVSFFSINILSFWERFKKRG